MSPREDRIRQNLADVLGRIGDAARRSGRRPEDVRLVAVTKYVGPAEAAVLVEARQCDLGESRPQSLWSKAAHPALAAARWHLVGHLQTNKVRRTLPFRPWIHSLDSLHLAMAIDREAAARVPPLVVDLLLEINVSGDSSKTGLAEETVSSMLEALARLKSVRVRGLMAMSGLEHNLLESRRDFARLKSLQQLLKTSGPSSLEWDQLSMGMSGDFEVAVEEGATMVRVGTALWEGVAGDSG
jgi:hypothetical protein